MAAISIIVPVYKAEEYLDRCIDSILSQSFSDFELILIDDGSPDRSGEICDQYALKDRRIQVIHQENDGVSAARNTGLHASSAEYITFCDSDDEMCPDCLETLMSYPNTVDLVIASHRIIDDSGEARHIVSYQRAFSPHIDRSIILDLIQTEAICYVWSKRFKRKVLIENQIAFDLDLSLAEDTLFVAEYLIRIDSIAIDEHICYRYRQHGGERLTKLDDSFFDRIYSADEKIIVVLEKRFNAIMTSDPWKKRMWSLFQVLIRQTLDNERIPVTLQVKQLNKIYRCEMYRMLRNDIDRLDEIDGNRFKKMLTFPSPLPVVAYSQISKWKRAFTKLLTK